MDASRVFEEIDKLYPTYLDVLEDVAKIESPSNYKAGVDAVGDYFINMAKERNWKVDILPESVSGNAVCITLNADAKAAPIALSGHIDTVHPLGLFKEPLVSRDEQNLYGPGVLDCKGGVVAAFLAMDALDRCGFKERPVMLILQSDEEVSSVISDHRTIKFMCEKAKNAAAFLNLEPRTEKCAIICRKGILRYRFTIHGKAGHSSKCARPNVANAVTEAAYKIIELEKMKDEDGLTCNCGVINGGTVANSVADTCVFTADIRFSTQKQLEEVKVTIKRIAEKSAISGCYCDVEEVSFRPAMEKCERNIELFNKINVINEKVGLPYLESKNALGGADAAYTTIEGIPSIDGLGLDGGGGHSRGEYVVMTSLSWSAKQQAAITLML